MIGRHHMGDDDASAFEESGFVVLRGAFDPATLSEEFDRAFADGFPENVQLDFPGSGIGGRYLPMMCEHTPVSLSLLDRFAGIAERLLGAPVLPVRAKGTLYLGEARLHRDSDLDVASIGFAAYLEPLDAATGALRVVPGSHHTTGDAADDPRAEHAVETVPGDVIAFDEHLAHGSAGGTRRRQWRVDYVASPVDTESAARVRDYFAGIFAPGWDGGYDVDRYPTYGEHWQASGRPWVEPLRALGVYDASSAEEAFARSRRA